MPLKYAARSQADDGALLTGGSTRVVPPAIARRGSYIAPNTVLMPSYVNIGAYVDSGTMVDTWATVGSCAQIGKNVHLSGGVGIGGVLEPLQAAPTIIEDNCFIGARSEVVEGVIVEEGSVISMGVFIGQSTKIYDRATRPGPAGPRARGIRGGVGQPALVRRQVLAVLRGDREARRRADARQDVDQRAVARGLKCAPTRRRAHREARARTPSRGRLLPRDLPLRAPGDAADGRGPRAALTTIYFLLPAGVVSRWHRVTSDEVWHLYEGGPLEVLELDPALRRALTTPAVATSETPVCTVAADHWQAARTLGDYALVGCTVGPGFDFEDFTMLADDAATAERVRSQWPELASLI